MGVGGGGGELFIAVVDTGYGWYGYGARYPG